MAFLTGVTGQFYKQFAVTIAISTVISAINSLTLSPALAARAAEAARRAQGRADAPDRPAVRLGLPAVQPLLRRELRSATSAAVSRTLQPARRGVRGVRGAARSCAGVMFQAVPGGFIPTQDKLYLIGGVKLPEGASLDRTERGDPQDERDRARDRRRRRARSRSRASTRCSSPTRRTPASSSSASSRSTSATARAEEINAELNAKFAGIQEGFAFAIMPPPILGLGQGSGYSLFVQDRAGLGYGELQNAVSALSGRDRADAGHALPDQHLPGQRAAARCAGRPRQGQGAGRAADRAVRHAADLPRLGLRQRLQPLRPHLPGDRAGRRPVPRRRRGHRQPAHAQRRRRDGADRQHGHDHARPTAPIR